MGISIKGGNTGDEALVTTDKLLGALSVTTPPQFYISCAKKQAYQVNYVHTISGAGTETVFHFANNDANRDAVFTYIRLQPINLATTGAFGSGTYFLLKEGQTVSSGGTAVTPVNMNFGSNNTASVTVTANNPTLAGTATEFDRWYPGANLEMLAFNKEGSLIVPQNANMTIKIVTDFTSGSVIARASFVMIDPAFVGQ